MGKMLLLLLRLPNFIISTFINKIMGSSFVINELINRRHSKKYIPSGRGKNEWNESLRRKLITNDTTLTCLTLMSQFINDDIVISLANALKWNSTVTHLGLGGYDIGYDGLVALAECIQWNCTITDINLAIKDINDDGAKVLADLFLQNKTLVTIYIYYKTIGNNGKEVLSEFNHVHKTRVLFSWKSIFD